MAVYRPLNDSVHEIRVLRILPEVPSDLNQTSDRIECLLEYISLDDSPSYHALSYTWQLPESDVTFSDRDSVEYNADGGVDITLDGHVVSVTFNLWAALKHFRYLLSLDEESEIFPKKTRLWVDAVCINQQDLSERSAQVRQMRQIYQKAECVDVWLGPEANNSSLAWIFVKKYTDYTKTFDPQCSSLNGDRKDPEERLRPYMDEWIVGALENPDNTPSWNALTKIFERSYWRRLWTVQEIVSNQHAWAHCGRSSMDLTLLLGAGNLFVQIIIEKMDMFIPSGPNAELYGIVSALIQAVYPLTEIPIDRNSYRDPDYSGNDLALLLAAYREHISSDPRDSIYALAGLSSQYPDEQLKIDYSLPVSEAFKAAARYMVRGSKVLQILWQAGNWECLCSEGTHLPSTELPSWIPDWCCRTALKLGIFHNDLNAHQYPRSADQPAIFSSNGNIMICLGFEIGIIENICHLDEVADWRTPETLVRTVLSAEGLLNLGTWAIGMLWPEIRPKLAELYKTMCLSFTAYRVVQTVLSERQFEAICRGLFLSDERTSYHTDSLDAQLEVLENSCRGRTWFNTIVRAKYPVPSRRTAMGVCASTARLTDKIVVLRGCYFPVLLRERPEAPGTYTYIKEVYLHGFMHGEGVGMFDEQSFEIH